MSEYLFSQQEALDLVALLPRRLKRINGMPVDEWLEAHEHRERTCRIEFPIIDWENWETDCVCSECGFSADPYDWEETYRFCPNCGARVVAPDGG